MAANATDCYMKQELVLVDTACNKLKKTEVEILASPSQQNTQQKSVILLKRTEKDRTKQ